MDLILKSLKSKTVQFSIALAVLSILQGYVGFLPVSPAGQAVVGYNRIMRHRSTLCHCKSNLGKITCSLKSLSSFPELRR